MSLLTKTQAELYTDSIARKIQDAADGFSTAALSTVNRTLFEQIDGVGNSGIELFLGQSAADLDAALWDESNLILNRLGPLFGPALARLQAQVANDATLGTLTFDALLTALGAQVSPVIQKIAGSPNAFGANLSAANVFAPACQSSALDAVFVGTDGALVDKTAEAASATAADVEPFVADDDVLYLGWNRKPTTTNEHVSFALSTLGSQDAVLTFQYWDGVQWTTLTTTDGDVSGTYANQGTLGMSQKGLFKFAVPARWSRGVKNPSGTDIIAADLTPRYYIRIARTGNTLVTPPVISTIRRGIGLGLVLITGTNACTFVAGAAIDTTLYDAVNRLKFRDLTAIGSNVTATVVYTNRAGTTGRSQAQSAWSSIDPLDVFPASGSSWLTLATANEGVKAVTNVTVVTAATTGAFIIESVQARTEAK